MPGPTRVAVIDDDDITRRGTALILHDHPQIEVVHHSDHAGRPEDWRGIDVVIVDASDHRRPDDQFPGVEIVQSVRASGAACVVIVLTGVLFDDVVRRRMREAGADFYYHRSEITDARLLVDAVLGNVDRRPVPAPADAEALFRLGITDATRINDGIAAARQVGLLSGDPALGRRGHERTNRRRHFNDSARLNPVTAKGRPPDRTQDAPSLPQIDRFLRWATRMNEST